MEVGVFISEKKIDFEPKTVTRDKGGIYIMIKGSIHPGDITIAINIQSHTTLEHLRILSKTNRCEERKSQNTIIVVDINTPCSAMDRLYRQKINKKMKDFNCTYTKWT